MDIIRATKAHLEQLTPLFDGYRVFYQQVSDLDGARQFLMERLEKKDAVIFVAMDSHGNGLGFTQLYPMFSSVSMQRSFVLNDLYVAEVARGQGIGAALLKYAQAFAKENKSKGLTLETDTDNPAQKLYRKLGWVKDTQVNHYTWKA